MLKNNKHIGLNKSIGGIFWQHFRGVSKGGAGEAIAPPLFGRIEGAASDGDTPRYYLYYYLPPTLKSY